MKFKDAVDTVRAVRRMDPDARVFIMKNVERGHPEWGFIFVVHTDGTLYRFNREYAYAVRPTVFAIRGYAKAHVKREHTEGDDWEVEVFPEIQEEMYEVGGSEAGRK